MSKPNYVPANFNNAGKLSSWMRLTGEKIIGFITPAVFASTAVTFNMTPSQQSNPVVSYPVKNSSGAISFTVTTSSYYGFTQDQAAAFEGVENIQLAGGTSEASGTNVLLVLIPRESI